MTDPARTPSSPAQHRSGRDAYWHFVRSMFRYWGLMAASFVFVVLSGFSLGAGLMGASPVLENILGGKKGLPEFASDWNAKLTEIGNSFATAQWMLGWMRIPESKIASLPTAPFTALVIIMAALAVLAVVGAAANFLHAYFSLTVVNRTVTVARRRAFAAALRAPLGHVMRAGPADLIARIVNDSAQLANGLNVLMSKALLQVIKGIAALGVAIAFDWRVTAGALLVAPGLYQIIRKLGKKIKRASGRALESQSGLFGAATEALTSLRVVKVNTGEAYEIGRFHRINKTMLRELNRVRTARALASPLTEMLSIFLLCGLVLLAGSAVINGEVKPKDFVLVLAFLAVAGSAFKPLTGIINDIQAAAPAADRVKELIDLGAEPGHGRGLKRLARHTREIEFKGVCFTYPGGATSAIRDVSLRVPHGRRVAFVGPNGCGKTTLLSLVPRLFDPEAGEVLIDGVDVRTVSLRTLRSQMGVVTQESVLFKGTIAQNIAYGCPSATPERILAAAKKARADEFIRAMPGGYESMVAEGGTSLSGGQRQRLVIARAILRDPAVLILDEATSMVDAESEARITEALGEFSAGRTTLIVAHRLSTVLTCDAIVVMNHGAVIDQGRHDELFARCPLYQELARHQFLDGTQGQG